jgi:hypothetical protein
MYLQSKNRYLKTAVVLGILVSLGSMSSANARGHTHHKWVIHDVYIVDTRPPLIAPVSVAVAPSRCETPVSNTVVVPSGNNYSTQHRFLVNDDGITTDQQANPHTPSQQVQLNYYDE